MRVLGVDPGTRVTGFGAVDQTGGVLRHLEHGALRFDPSAPLEARLLELQRGLDAVVDRVRPDAISVEGLFYSKNVQSALKLAHARGVVLLVVAARGVPFAEYSPMEVKRSVVGNGRATKPQLGAMVKRLLALDQVPQSDAGDALAMAICHLHSHRLAAMRSRRGRGAS